MANGHRPIRIEMLVEAVDVIRTLWQGGMQDYDGIYYHLKTLDLPFPDELPPSIWLQTVNSADAVLITQMV